MNKNVLIILGIILAVVVLGLGIYAYNLSKMDIPAATPSKIDNSSATKNSASSDSDIEAIQDSFSNESAEVYLPEDGQLDEETQKEIESQVVTSAKGVIKSKGTDSIVVSLDHQGTVWDATVGITQETSVYLPSSSPTSMGELVSLEQLSVGDEVIVNGEGSIVNSSSFNALSIHKIK